MTSALAAVTRLIHEINQVEQEYRAKEANQSSPTMREFYAAICTVVGVVKSRCITLAVELSEIHGNKEPGK